MGSQFVSTSILTSVEIEYQETLASSTSLYTLMKTSRILVTILSAFFAFGLSAEADIIPFDLQGNAGFGLLPGNENPPATGGAFQGTGGEIGAGITFDTITLVLQINIGWGSGNGFADLSGDATLGHVHGATADTPPAAFSQNASPIAGGTLHTLPGWNPSASVGSFQGSLTLTAAQATDLLAGRFYLNIHTSANGGGEIRGQLVPEPSSVLLLALGGLGVVGIYLRSRKA
jgi:hypothetical protein